MKSPHPRLKQLLDEQESFPCDFIVKFIGRNSPGFRQGAQALELRHAPHLKPQSARESAGGKNLALTYIYVARSSDEIVAVLEQVSLIEDVLVIL